ncbi:hypothetical protein MKY30_16250 [Oceanobacillus sp. FSL W8-0428]|uniref:hypothetical protein n=1 Tax=Oceanobacillus TaxID=182709 RepID=UPI0030F5E8D9
MLKVIVSFILLMFIFGGIYYVLLNLSEKKVWRVVNAVWVLGLSYLGLCYPAIYGFQVSSSLGFKYILVGSIIFIGALVFMKGISWMGEKGIVKIAEIIEKKKMQKE